MPGLAQYNQLICSSSNNGVENSCNGSVVSGFWSNRHLTYGHLHKFWSELSIPARQELLKIDKQTLFEQARKNMYCSRCNGLLLEGFLQIVMYGKSLPHEGAIGTLPYVRQGALKSKNNSDLDLTNVPQYDIQDPSIHLWGGLAATRDGFLTVLDCYLYAKSLKGLQIVFDSARARERERELLYPDACGGGGRGWISQGISGYGRGHGARDACALHTARLSVDALVDFWSALADETRQSLMRMKEEDFIERLMYRFDSKRFCRDCRKNVIREFKELKELKRLRKEPRCTSWFCVADTAFEYEVSHDSVLADWHEAFMDTIEKYHHFEWAVGTGEGKSDILDFENVGINGRVHVSGLDLGRLTACYITLRAWKMDGRCNEFSVKAHALNGQQCVHCRLVVGDGFVSITRGESIRRYFEHAEEAEEEEDDDSMDKNGNNVDGECSRPQKHAKSPELAREFLLDAATVIFKEQVEKAFKEGTARQNAHSVFVSLALKVLEERVHVACKEIITLEKQTKLLEEEEKEKREEEERKERKRTKEREKKLRRKERLRVKDKDKDKDMEKKSSVSSKISNATNVLDDDKDDEADSAINCEKPNVIDDVDPVSPDIQDKNVVNESVISEMESHSDEGPNVEFTKLKSDSSSYPVDQSKISHRKSKFRKESWSETSRFAVVSETRVGVGASEPKNNGPKCGERFHFGTSRTSGKNDFSSCNSCNRHNEYRPKVESHDVSKQYYRVNRYNQMDYTRDNSGRFKSKVTAGNNSTFNRDSPHVKKVWEPTDSLKKYPRSNSDTDVMAQASNFKAESGATDKIKLSGAISSEELSEKLHEKSQKENNLKSTKFSKDTVDGYIETCVSKIKTLSVSSTSDNCFSEGDSNTSSSSSRNVESSSDSEDANQLSERKNSSKVFPQYPEAKTENTDSSKEREVIIKSRTAPEYSPEKSNLSNDTIPRNQAHNMENLPPNVNIRSRYPSMVPSVQNPSVPFPMYQAPPSATSYYHHQSPVSWANTNGILPFHPPSHYAFPSQFEYGMDRDPRYIQYGTRQHPTSLPNLGQVPIYRPVVRTNEVYSKDQNASLKTFGARESFGKVSSERTAPMPKGNFKKPQEGNSGFSLFHFGSPVARPEECELNPRVPCKDGIFEDERASGSNKKPVGEYNLFAEGNGMRFPFF